MVEKDINLGDITPIIPNELFKAINLEMITIIENICIDNNLELKKVLDTYVEQLYVTQVIHSI
jgi:hypothetical protein